MKVKYALFIPCFIAPFSTSSFACTVVSQFYKYLIIIQKLFYIVWYYLVTSFFFNYYLVVPPPTLGHSQGGSLTNPMLITVFIHIRPKGHREPHNKVGSLSAAKRLTGFESGFWLQCLNPQGHSPSFQLSNKFISYAYFEPPLPLYKMGGGVDFLKFGNKGRDEIFFLEREGLD